MRRLEDLLTAWRRDPSAERAVALCEELTAAAERARRSRLAAASGTGTAKGSPAGYVPVVIAAAREAGTRHGDDPKVLLAIARMYLATGELTAEAQHVIVRAARLAPDDPRGFELLGQALLLRGDAQRAVRAFERAVALGLTDDATRALHARACSLAVVQASAGEAEVAREVRRDLGLSDGQTQTTGTMRASDLLPSEDDELTRVKTAVHQGLAGSLAPPERQHQAAWAGDSSDEGAATLVTSMEEILASIRPARPIALDGGRPQPREERDSEPTLLRELPAEAEGLGVGGAFEASADPERTGTITLPARASGGPGAVGRIDDEDTQVDQPPSIVRRAIEAALKGSTTEGAAPPRGPDADGAPMPGPPEELAAAEVGPKPVLLGRRLAEAARSLPSITHDSDSEIRVHHALCRDLPGAEEGEAYAVPMGPPMRIEELVDELSKSEVRTAPFPAAADGGGRPSADRPHVQSWHHPGPLPSESSAASEVVEMRAPLDDGAPVAPPKRSIAGWVIAFAVTAAAAGGVYLEMDRRSAEAARESAELVERAGRQLRSGGLRELSLALGDARRARELMPRSKTAALALVRAASIAVLDDDPAAHATLADAVAHARTLGAVDAELAAASVVLAVARNDMAAAREIVARQGAASREPDGLLELAAGAALEAAGDPGATARYEAAARADATLGSAHVRLARARVLARDASGAAASLAAMAERGSGLPESRVLSALAGVALRDRGEPTPPPLGDLEAADVVRPLRSLAWVLRARERPEAVGASAGLAAAIDDADTPAVMVFCGSIALELGDVDSAQRAAARASAVAPRFEPASALAAEVALARGKLDDARRALTATGVLGARARALLAYEQGDLAALVATSTAVPELASALRTALTGSGAAPSASAIGAPHADLVECDAALDRGDLAAARAVVARWPDAKTHPLRSIRWARLERYEGRTPPSDVLASFAPTRRGELERLLAAAESRDERSRAIVSLGEPAGSDETWLAAYLQARHGRVAAARRTLRRARPPAPDAPLRSRVLAALALAEIEDRPRGQAVLETLIASFGNNPDVARAASKLGVRKK